MCVLIKDLVAINSSESELRNAIWDVVPHQTKMWRVAVDRSVHQRTDLLLLAAQRHGGIYARGAKRGHPTGNDGDGQEN